MNRKSGLAIPQAKVVKTDWGVTMQIELRSWAELYDTLRYPVSIYEELVVEQQPFEHRFAVMGAWKTGSISTSSEVTAYTDKSGRDFFYSNRWKKEGFIFGTIWPNETPRLCSECHPSLATRILTSSNCYANGRDLG